MRTTVNLDDDLLSAVRQYAENRSVSVTKAVSELVRRGINAALPIRIVNGLKVFDLPPDSPRVARRRVRQLEADDQQ